MTLETADVQPMLAALRSKIENDKALVTQDAVRVLVVDDSVDLAEAIGALLASRGYQVQVAIDAASALVMVDEDPPHCVLLDVQMPGMDGHAFAQSLRERYRDDIVLVAISGHPATAPTVAATFRIVDHYLQKPVDVDALSKILPDLT